MLEKVKDPVCGMEIDIIVCGFLDFCYRMINQYHHDYLQFKAGLVFKTK